MAKGIELPVNVLVIVAIAVIVLIGLIVLLAAGIGGANPIFIELEKASACNSLRQSADGCKNPASSISISNKTGYTSLDDLCRKYLKPSITDDSKCKIVLCGCKESEVS